MDFLRGLPKVRKNPIFRRRDFFIGILSVTIGASMGIIADVLKQLINFVTNLAYYSRFSLEEASPAEHHWGIWVCAIPAFGGLLVGLLARFVNRGVYGHGIPETMEKIILNDSLIQKRMLLLKPAAAAISVGTGGPFGDEGPIIATGGTLGSAVGQWIRVNSYERRILLAAGASGAVAAAFGSPCGGIFLSMELMLFEFKQRSIVPVVLSALSAQAMRSIVFSNTAVFPIPTVTHPNGAWEVIFYFAMGIFIGFMSVGITHMVHFLETAYERLPCHWMWWPAIGGMGVGLIGLLEPRVLGAGYGTITSLLSGHIVGMATVSLFSLKLAAWLVGVSSRTTAGTLAPLLLIGSALGLMLQGMGERIFHTSFSPEIAALVGMGALFSGVTRAFLASVFIVLESTQQFGATLPVLAGCAASYIGSLFLTQHSLLTHELSKKGIPHIPENN